MESGWCAPMLAAGVVWCVTRHGLLALVIGALTMCLLMHTKPSWSASPRSVMAGHAEASRKVTPNPAYHPPEEPAPSDSVP